VTRSQPAAKLQVVAVTNYDVMSWLESFRIGIHVRQNGDGRNVRVGDYYSCTPTPTKIIVTNMYFAHSLNLLNIDTTAPPNALSINLIEWPRIREARIPDLVHNLHCLDIILTGRSSHHRLNCPRPYAILMLLCKVPIIPCPKLPHPSTLST
jgi:hypothetical protein